MNKRPIVIVTAMDAEFDFLLQKLSNVEKTTIDGYNYYKGTVQDYPVIIAHSLVMSLNATLATYIAIKEFNPLFIISQGNAGSHSNKLHVGDIVVGEKTLNIQSADTLPKPQGAGSNSLDWILVDFISGEENILRFQNANPSLIQFAKNIKNENGNVYFGTIGSGDIWNKEIDKINLLNSKYGSLCEDMEAHSVYTVANKFNIPVIGIKVISNNEILKEQYVRNISICSQEFTYKLIIEILNKKAFEF